ncbi:MULTISPECIES: lysophospholipid acyltransferase family protein [unclassified Desulfurobacterium]|uniref:lysophospholipid acyltransferase family protein n=1 Tax=Desulfurobacterium sp. TC5-1 TaxID=1158318 RepID=UPI0003B7A3C0|nr:lysophospholipid acyltransferase family protein [Desulfurobacterium sp. TC5-1]
MNKKLSYRMEYLLLRLLKEKFLRKFSRDRALSIADSLASFFYSYPRVKKVSEENLRFVGMPVSVGKEAFKTFVKCSVDFFRSENYSFKFLDSILSLRKESTISMDELIALDGGILLTAHIGNWELLGGWFSHVSRGRLSVVAKPLKNLYVNEMVNTIRNHWNIKVIPTGNVIEIIKDLKRKRFIGILLDQRPKEKDGVLVRFLGRDTFVNKGAAVLSVKTGKPVIPAFCYMEPDNSYTFEVHKPIYPEGRSVEELTKVYSDWIEMAVKKRPEQWFWSHRRWSNSPEFKKWKEKNL